jgi:hypothetical protein
VPPMVTFPKVAGVNPDKRRLHCRAPQQLPRITG